MFNVFNYTPPPPPPQAQKAKRPNEVAYSKNPTKLFKRVEGKAWESAIERVSTNQVEPRIWVVKTAFDGSLTWRRLPLHEACIRKPPPKLIQKLLQSYPRAALKPDSDGRLPLHHACANNAAFDVVEKLIMVYPESMEVKDKWKKTPLQTLMSSYFPDPHVISALKKDVEYYHSKAMEEAKNGNGGSDAIGPIRASSSQDTTDWNPQLLSSKSGDGGVPSTLPRRRSRERELLPQSPSQSAPESPTRSYRRTVGQDSVASTPPVDRTDKGTLSKDAAMTSALEDEIGKFSKQIASSMTKENSMQKKIQSLEAEVDRLLVIENDNNRLKSDLSHLENEYMLTKSTLDREREETQRDIQMIEELRRSEDNLKRQVDELSNDPRPRILEDKVSSLVHALDERDERHKMEVQNLQRAFRNVEEDAMGSQKAAGHLEDDNNRLSLELKRLEYQLSAQRDAEQQLLERLNEAKHMSVEMEMLERRCKDQEKKLGDMNNKLDMVEKENTDLRHDKTELSRLQIKFRGQEDYVHDLDEKLRRAKEEIQTMSEQMSGKERDSEHQKMSISSEKNKLERKVEELLGDLNRSEQKNADAMREKDDLDSKLKIVRMSLRQATQERDDLEKQQLAINMELNKIQRTLDVKIGEYKQKFLDEQVKATSSAQRCNSLEEEIMTLRDTINKTSAANAEAMRDSMKLRENIKDKELSLERIEREKRELEERLAHTEGGKEKYRRKAHDAQSKLKDSDHAKITLDSEMRVLSSEKDKFLSEREDLMRKNSSLNKELHEARSQMSIAVLKESDFLSKLNQARNEMAKMKSGIDHVEREKSSVEMKVKEIEFQNEVLTREKRHLEAEKSELMAQMSLTKIEVQRKGVRDQDEIIVDLQRQISALRKLNNERDLEIRKLLEQQGISRRQKEVLQEQKADLKKQLSFMRKNNTRRATDPEGEAEIEKLRDQLVKDEREKQRLQEKVSDLESQISSMTMEAELMGKKDGGNQSLVPGHLERMIEKQSTTIQALRDERERMHKQLDQKEEETRTLSKMLEQSDDLSELAELTERLELVEEEKDSEISHLMEEREELRQEVTRLEEKVVTLENDLKRISTTSDISKLKELRDRKKKNLHRRLAAYENRISSTSTVVSSMSAEMRARHLRYPDDDSLSLVSGVTMGSRRDTEKINKWKSKYRVSNRGTKNDTDGLEQAFLSPLSDCGGSVNSHKEAFEPRKRNEKKTLEYMFPSTVSVTGLSFDASEISAKKKDVVPRDVTIARVPSVILEDRNGSECGSR